MDGVGWKAGGGGRGARAVGWEWGGYRYVNIGDGRGGEGKGGEEGDATIGPAEGVQQYEHIL